MISLAKESLYRYTSSEHVEYLLLASVGSPVFRFSQIHAACCYVYLSFAPRLYYAVLICIYLPPCALGGLSKLQSSAETSVFDLGFCSQGRSYSGQRTVPQSDDDDSSSCAPELKYRRLCFRCLYKRF